MKIHYIILLISLISFTSYCQDSSIVKNNFTLNSKLGLTYQGFLREVSRYKHHYPTNSSETQYGGFTREATPGFRIGIIADFKIHKTFHLSTGLVFAQRKEIYQGNRDSVLYYGTQTSIHNIVKYEYDFNNLEIPILFSLKLRKLSLQAGVNLILVSFYKAHYSYIPNPNISNDKTFKTIKNTELSKTIYPTLQASYNLQIKRFEFSPFIGLDFALNKSLYFQGGIIIPLIN